MKPKLTINSVLRDLELIETSIDVSDIILSVYHIFEENKSTPGVILIKNGRFYGLLSKVKFFEVMSKQFMYDLYSKRKIEVFFDESNSASKLIISASTSILKATNLALNRSGSDIFEPIIISLGGNEYRLLDFYTLLIAQNEIQSLMNDLLKQANEFKKEVLAITTHDLRNPISVILGFSDLISDCDDPDKFKEFASHIRRAASQMEDLVNSFLSSTMNDSIDYKLEISEFEIVELVRCVVDSLEPSAAKKKQRIVFESLKYPVLITSDMLKIKEVIENLLSNAIKYSEINKEIIVSLQKNEKIVIIRIKDEGPGFSEADLKKIFGKFQRLSAKPTGDESSTGLGLFITKTIVEKLNGSIKLDTEFGRGTTFIVELALN